MTYEMYSVLSNLLMWSAFGVGVLWNIIPLSMKGSVTRNTRALAKQARFMAGMLFLISLLQTSWVGSLLYPDKVSITAGSWLELILPVILTGVFCVFSLIVTSTKSAYGEINKDEIIYQGKQPKGVAKKTKNAPISGLEDENHKIRWQELREEGDRLISNWLSLCSVENVLQMPLLGNLRDPLVKKVIIAIQDVRAERSSTPAKGINPEHTAFAKAVKELRGALAEAELHAKGSAKDYRPEEREKLELAQQLLNIAKSPSAADTERKNAYRKMRDLMDDLSLEIPEESEQNLQIEMKDILGIAA